MMTPTEVHETLDTEGWLDASRGPGCYALRLTDPPDDPRAVFEAWTAVHGHAPQYVIDGLADTTRLAYVGQSSNVYERLIDHAEGEVRQTAIMRVFPPVDVLGVKAVDEPSEQEYNYAKAWIEREYDCWVDGALL